MRYKCCECEGEFDGVDAIDGFKQGYTVGFLCPLCDANIQDNLISTRAVFSNPKEAAYYTFGGVLLSLIFCIVWMLDNPSWRHYAFLLSPLVLYFVFGFIKYPKAMVSPVMSTQRVPQK